MKTLLIGLMFLGAAASAVAKVTAKRASFTRAQEDARIESALHFASSPKRLGLDLYLGWGRDAAKMRKPVLDSAGSVRVSVAHGAEFKDYLVKFGKSGKPSKVVFAGDNK